MRGLLNQVKWQLLIFHRNNLILMIIGITVGYLAIIYFLNGIGNTEKFVTLLIINDPATIGFLFVGISVILEKEQDVFSALSVTPINYHIFLIARVVALSSVSMICVWGMVLMAKGILFNPIHFSVGTFFTCVIFSFLGIFIVSRTTDILRFVLFSIPFVIVMSLPLFVYFNFTDFGLLKIFPIQGTLLLIDNSYREIPSGTELFLGYLLIAIWTPILYWIAYRSFVSKLVNV